MLDSVCSRIFYSSLSGGRGAFGMSGRKSGLASLQFGPKGSVFRRSRAEFFRFEHGTSRALQSSVRTGSRGEDRTTSGASGPQDLALVVHHALHTS